MDPSKDPSFFPSNYGAIAHYVQVINTSKFYKFNIGDIDIDLKCKPGMNLENGLDFFMFVATATKRLYALAAESGDGQLILKGKPFSQPKPKEIVVGVYSAANKSQYRKKFTISIAKRTELFREALGRYQDEAIFVD